MRLSLLALLAATTVSAQTINTQVEGITLTGGLTSLSDTSSINPINQTIGINYLTDNDVFTGTFNVGQDLPGTSLQGSFGGPVSPFATGIFVIGVAQSGTFNGNITTLYNGPTFTVKLSLTNGLTTGRVYGDPDYVISAQQIESIDVYQNVNGQNTVGLNPSSFDSTMFVSYLYIPFSDFAVTAGQVQGIRFEDFTSRFPDMLFVGGGYFGTPVPEPSTYGLILGGLALAGATLRRRQRAK